MLWGRDAEQAAIDALLARARAGVSGALILRGEPGIGKTALLDYAAGQAQDFRVLRGAGIESEAELPFAGLYLLLRTVLGSIDALPGPQHKALSGAFGLGVGGGDRFMIGAGVLSLLADVAEPEPLLCLVDDAQWLDRASTEALLFAARRLDREGVVILFAVRDYPDALDSSGIPELVLEGLDDGSAAAMLGQRLPAARRRQLIEETRGNPLALQELPPLVDGSQLGPIPLTTRVLDAFHHQVGSLPVATQTLLLIAAADDTGELPILLRAAGELTVGIADLQPAEERGLVSLATGTLEFRHPLIRAAVYHGAPGARRIAAHAALANAYAGHRDVDRRAWHLAVAATEPDERVAADLEQAADRAVARSGYAAAAAAYERAAQLSEDTAAATRRITLACEAGVNGGRLDWARERAERVDVADRVFQARLIELRAGADFAQGGLRQAHKLFTEGAALIADDDPERAFWMQMKALHAAWAAPTDQALIAETVDRFDALAPNDSLRAVAWLARWATALTLDRDTTNFPPLEEIIQRARLAGGGPRGLIEVTSRAFVAARDADVADLATTLVADARTNGMIFALPAGLGFLTLVQVMLGRHREALIGGTEGLRIARDTGQPIWISYLSGALAYLAAVEGDEETCRRHAAEAGLEKTAHSGALAGTTWAQAALALLDLGLGRVPNTLGRLQAIARGTNRHQAVVVRCVPDLIEAAVRLGRPEDATAPLELFTRWATSMRQPWIDALLARCQAMITPDDEHYLKALGLHPPGTRPFERARTELLFGEWLRRTRRKTEARVHLQAALETFEELGSTPWAARARAELGATGAAIDRTVTPDVFAELTPQEQQITQLAAQGMSNRDIAAQLFLSPRTVAYHLYKAYPKLGINSRGELALLATGSG